MVSDETPFLKSTPYNNHIGEISPIPAVMVSHLVDAHLAEISPNCFDCWSI